ncbi:protein GAMETE EXPRESSED 1-like isoform X2 [Phragmites australis]|uniref:protein GAMETE EXPRESSED 1-like isoform X2 n=1 Tax=Phragmites australis TaxID=29695 RepID=UPI002D7795DB|nr:protein GAMETE EXPRESSED 1-like isoform X2 [Phragmites australis]
MRSTGLRLAVILVMLCCATNAFSWSLFSSASKKTSHGGAATPQLGGATVADFSIEGAKEDPRGARLLENARLRIAGPATCWSEAYGRLFASCADIMADKERQSRLAWHLSGCFQEDSGRPPLPPCDERSAMVHCRKRLTDSEGKVFLEFFLETNTLCHQLQAEAFKHSTERLVNDLSRSSKSAHEKLEVIEKRSDHLLQESENIRGSLSSITAQTDHLTAASKAVRAQIGDVLECSRAISEQSKEIAGAQAELKAGQAEMRGAVEAGMARVVESYRSLGSGMDKLREDAVGVERGIRAVGDAMSSKMDGLQRTADDIGSVAGRSLENQMQLLDGQAKAMRGLNDLYSLQAQALEESSEAIQKLAHFGQQQQEELLARQEEIRHAHDHLIQNSHSILEAQEEFRAKQANIFAALDKLYVLHNAILVESRFIKAFFFYCCIAFLIYVLTSAKQTFDIRGQLYFGLCVTIMLEIGVIKLGTDDFSCCQYWIVSKVLLLRSAFLAAAVVQILHSIFTYKDYDVLNHQLLQTLVEKVQAIEGNAGGGDEMYDPYSSGSDGSLGDYSWVFDELQDEVDSKFDPDFMLTQGIHLKNRILTEEIGENSITTSDSRRYNLLPRIRPR